MEFAGLPLHPLVIHAAVVFGPLAGLAAMLYAIVPGWRDGLRWPMVVLAVVTVGAVWVAYASGQDLREARFATAAGEFLEKLDRHEERATQLRVIATAFAVLALLTGWLHDRRGAAWTLLVSLTAVAGLSTLVWTVLTGDAGARATWG